ncbi:MAG: sensor histidine kinase N-terminal domain-containing protein [Betaproteobacteria bacterium]
MAARSLRAHLLRMLLPPIGALLIAGALLAYTLSIEPATLAYDQALTDVAVSLASYVRGGDAGERYRFEIPPAVEQVLRADRYDTIYYRVIGPDGRELGGDPALPAPPRTDESSEAGPVSYDTRFRGQKLRAVALEVPCASTLCKVIVGETTVKRAHLAREIVFSTLIPEMLIALATLIIVWFAVKRGLGPLARLSDEIKARSPGDLRPVDATGTPEETRALVSALNGLLNEVAEASRKQQRFLANAAHQLRTPLAGLQTHTEIALAQPLPEATRKELEQVHQATIRTARLANQLLTLARAEPGTRASATPLNLKAVVEAEADAWVHQALAHDIDLGFELDSAPVHGDAFLLREAVANLVHNAVVYTQRGGRATVRTGRRGGEAFVEVEDDGPGIPPGESARVLERFYRMPGTPGTGSGLGLAIVHDLARSHGAQLSVAEATAGRGCRVAITFPHG